MAGIWQPSKLLFGLVHTNFNAASSSKLNSIVDQTVPLEVGDSVYIFEQIAPFEDAIAGWSRGYVVSPSSTSNDKSLSLGLVSVGIFPTQCVSIRQQLQVPAAPDRPMSPVAFSQAITRTMEPLQEEQEEEDDPLQITMPASPTAKSPKSPFSKPRQQRISLASLVSEDARRRLSVPASVTVAEEGEEPPVPPLPALNPVDETCGGEKEPLIDELSSAIREWSESLVKHLSNRDYQLFFQTKSALEGLHAGRKALLFGGLSVAELSELRTSLIAQLADGNRLQGLDVVVRDTQTGTLVSSELSPALSWSSLIRLYHSQGLLAQSLRPSPRDLFHPPKSVSESAPVFALRFDFNELKMNMAAASDAYELYFSLYSTTEVRFITDQYCVVHPLVPHGRTYFSDLTAKELDSGMVLVARIVKNAPLPGASARAARTNLNTSQSSMSLPLDDTSSVHSAMLLSNSTGMLSTSSNGAQTVRTPFATAALDLSTFLNEPQGTEVAVQLRAYTPHTESSFSVLHEHLILNKAKHYELQSKISHIAASLCLVSGPLPIQDTSDTTQRLGLTSASQPTRNDIYIKLWAADFSESIASINGSVGSMNRSMRSMTPTSHSPLIEVSVEVRDQEGSLIPDAISRGSRERLNRFFSMVIKDSVAPSYGELFKVSLRPAEMQQSHLYFSFRNRAGAALPNNKRNSVIGFPVSSSHNLPNSANTPTSDRPFAFAFLPLFENQQCIEDGAHELPLYRPTAYNSAAYITSNNLSMLRDRVSVRTFLCSTHLSHDPTLSKLARWESLPQDELTKVIGQLRYVDQQDLVLHFSSIMSSLFGILSSEGPTRSLAFSCLVALLNSMSSSKAQLDTFIAQEFTSKDYNSLFRFLQELLRMPTSPNLRSALKVLPSVMALTLKCRANQKKGKTIGSDVTSKQIQAAFKRELFGVFSSLEALMTDTDERMRGTQVIAIQSFMPTLTVALEGVSLSEAADLAATFIDSIPTVLHVKSIASKLVCLSQLVASPIYADSLCRNSLTPALVRWLKPTFKLHNAYEDPAHSQSYLDNVRLANSIFASMLDQLQTATTQPSVPEEEWDSVEYALGLMAAIADASKELDSQNFRVLVASDAQSAGIFPTSTPLPPSSISCVLGELGATFCACCNTARLDSLIAHFSLMAETESGQTFLNSVQNIMKLAKATLSHALWPQQWISFAVCSLKAISKLVNALSGLLEQEWLPAQEKSYEFEFSLWRDFLAVYFSLVKSSLLTIEDFEPQRRKVVWRLAGDLRGVLCHSLQRVWDNLGWPDRRIFSSALTRLGGYQVQLGPSIADATVELCLSHHDEVRKMATWILFTLLLGEWHLHGNFRDMQNQIVDTLDRVFSVKRGDQLSRGAFLGHLRALFNAATLDHTLREGANALLDSISTFVDLLLSVKDLPESDEFMDDRIIGTLRLMTFIKHISSSAIFCRYVHRLKDHHKSSHNYTEAGLVLKLHADLYSWKKHVLCDALPEFDLPQQSEFERKERLYVEILQLLDRGQAWESALVLTKELQQQYETQVFAYTRLSEILAHQSVMYLNIVKEPRSYAKSFRVAFYGSGFPTSVQGKQFVYRAAIGEDLETFTANQVGRHAATLLSNDSAAASDEMQRSKANRFLQVLEVSPEPDRSFPIFQTSSVPEAVRQYYDHNGTNVFSFKKRITRAPETLGVNPDDYAHHFLSSWVEKTLLICTDAFPTVIKRTEVEEIRTQLVSPLERAIEDIEAQTQAIRTIENRCAYSSLSADNTELAMKLNSAVDPDPNEGVPFYRKVFLLSNYELMYREHVSLLATLRKSIETFTEVIHAGLLLHAKQCSPEMRPFASTLQKFFVKNFSDEIRRLPPSTLAELELMSSLHANGQPLNFDIPKGSPVLSRQDSLSPSFASSSPVEKTHRYSLQLVPAELSRESVTNGSPTVSTHTLDDSKSNQSSLLSRINSTSLRKPSLKSFGTRFGSMRRKGTS